MSSSSNVQILGYITCILLLTVSSTDNPSMSPTSPTIIPTTSPTSFTNNPSISPTNLPSISPTSATIDPTSDPTLEPTIPSESPTASPTPAPTPIPTTKGNFCNLFNGKDTSNNIQLKENTIISSIEIEDPLIIAFDFSVGENECTTTQNKICNLLQFGSSDENIWFPRISTKYDNGTLLWNIQVNDGNQSVNISYSLNKKGMSDESFGMKANRKSSFHITFSGRERVFYIGEELFHYSSQNNDFFDLVNESHPFYVSKPDTSALNANITNLCISTGSFSPSKHPTNQPSITPSNSPSQVPSKPITTRLYNKIECYSEIGAAGATSISCLESDYIIISCGMFQMNGIDINDIIFSKGTYIERIIMNDLTTDGICHINYNTNNINITQSIAPQARCCNFAQQYNDEFKCRYFASDEARMEGVNQDSSEHSASKANEFTFTTCPDEFPLLLSCTTRVDEDKKMTTSNHAESNADIQFYGGFYAPSPVPDGEYNPDKNLYFELNTGTSRSNKRIPFAPTSPTISSPTNDITPSPTFTPTSWRSELQLNMSETDPLTTRCVSQYGPIKGNYTVTAIATCCSHKYDSISSNRDIIQSTSAPSTAPTIKSPLSTALFGTNGTNTGDTFIENGETPIIGINAWRIYETRDARTIIIDKGNQSIHNQFHIYYQGVLIGSYQTIDSNGTKETKLTRSDFGSDTGKFVNIKECASFLLDTDQNGNRDFINGFDIYYTHIAIYGLTFYTSFGRKYSCPDDENFIDTSAQSQNLRFTTLSPIYYKMNKVSRRNVFSINGTYKLSGWNGWLQTRGLEPGVSRSVFGSISFLFIGNASINSVDPTPAPSKAPSKSGNKTLSPTFAGQEETESLKCYTMWGNKKIKCKSKIFDTMMGCSGYSVEGQILNTYINNTNEQCIVETINNKSAAAIATCCYFYRAPPRDFTVFIYTSIIGGSLFFLLFIFMVTCLFLNIKNVAYFDKTDIDDDTDVDNAWQNVGQDVASDKMANFKVTEKDHAEMVELARQNSYSTGLK